MLPLELDRATGHAISSLTIENGSNRMLMYRIKTTNSSIFDIDPQMLVIKEKTSQHLRIRSKKPLGSECAGIATVEFRV